jgi:hypothetical protein
MKSDEEPRFDSGMVLGAAAGALLLFLFVLLVVWVASGAILLLRSGACAE